MTDSEKNIKKRWYDFDPTISLAVNMLEKSGENVKIYCADLIIEQAKNSGAKLEIFDKNQFNYVWKRWQDNDEKMFEAMEYFKIIDFEAKQKVSMDIINYIRDIENKLK